MLGPGTTSPPGRTYNLTPRVEHTRHPPLPPGMCVARVPQDGRNFEYMTGESPFLATVLLPTAIKAIQTQGVMANAKHFMLCDQDTQRNKNSANADERTRMEVRRSTHTHTHTYTHTLTHTHLHTHTYTHTHTHTLTHSLTHAHAPRSSCHRTPDR